MFPIQPSEFAESATTQMREMISRLDLALQSKNCCQSTALKLVSGILSEYLGNSVLLSEEQKSFDEENYSRFLLYADPRFSVLALSWLPGQVSPIHGHNAWGVVGVHEGEITNTSYNVVKETCSVRGPRNVALASVGRIVATAEGDEGAHTLGNLSARPTLTIHIYGMDLSLKPNGINRYYDRLT